MIDFALVKLALENFFSLPDDLIVVSRSEKIKEGWIMFYTSQKYLETLDTSYLLTGPQAIMFDEHNRLYYPMGLAGECWEDSLISYRKNNYLPAPLGYLDLEKKCLVPISALSE